MLSVLFFALHAAAPAAGAVQQAFDAAEALSAANKPAEALAAYRALERRLTNRRTLAVVRLREGENLLLLGDLEGAAAALKAGLAEPAQDATLKGMQPDSLLMLAQAEEGMFDLPAASGHYREAAAAAPDDGDTRLAATAGMIRTGMFVDPKRAVGEARQGMALASARKNGPPALAASYRTLYGRALPNAGDAAAAKRELAAAVDDLGGLTLKVDRSDVAARSDAALAALLAKDAEAARRYLSYTGAGHGDQDLSRGSDMAPPPCGAGPAEPRPDDVAVVQLSVMDDGSVANITPIYASRPGMVAPFLKAVGDWTWQPEAVAKVKPFFRTNVRFELRCSTVAARPATVDLLLPAVTQWLAAQPGGAALDTEQADRPAAVAAARAELARGEAAAGAVSPRLLPPLLLLANSALVEAEERLALARRAVAIADTAASAPVVAFARIRADHGALTGIRSSRRKTEMFVKALVATAAMPKVAADPATRGVIALMLADGYQSLRSPELAKAVLEPLAADPQISPRDPLKVGALSRLATIRAAAGDLEGARDAYRRTGLDALQCALADAEPEMTRSGLGSGTYPTDAVRWGFEGWVRAEYDITAEGRPQGIRVIAAYPPFTFGPAVISGLSSARFRQSYRPEGHLGCGGDTAYVRFRMPG